MSLRLPHFERGVDSVRMVRWLKSPDETVEPGEDIAVIETEPRIKLDISRNAKLLSGLVAGAPSTGTRRVNIRVRMRLTAAERVVLRELIATPDSIYQVGDLLARVTTAAGEALDGPERRPMRLVVNEEGL